MILWVAPALCLLMWLNRESFCFIVLFPSVL